MENLRYRRYRAAPCALLPARCSRAGPVRTLLNLEADPAELDLIRLIRPEKSNNAVVNLPPTRVAKYECNGLPRLPRLVEVGGAGTAR